MPPRFNPGVKIQTLTSVPQRPTGQLEAVPEPFAGKPAAPEQQQIGLLALAAKGKTGAKPSGVRPSKSVTFAESVPVTQPTPAAAPKPTTATTATTTAPKLATATTAAPKSAPKPARPTKERVKTEPLEDYEFDDPKSIDFWIETAYSDDIGEDEIIRPKENLNAKLFGDSFSEYKTVHTIGDGSCLLHSILTCVSEAYRKVTTDKKRREIVTVFRTQVLPFLMIDNPVNEESSKIPLFSEEDKKQSWYEDILTREISTKGYNYLDDTVGYKLATFLNVNLVFFNAVNAQVGIIIAPEPIQEYSRFIFVYNYTEAHYEAIQLPDDSFTLDFEDGTTLMNDYAGTDKAFARAGLSESAELECKYKKGDQVEYNSSIYTILDIEHTSVKGKLASVCHKLFLIPLEKGSEVVVAYEAMSKDTETVNKFIQDNDIQIIDGVYNTVTKAYTFPMVKRVGEPEPSPVAAAVPEVPAASAPRPTRVLNSVKENLRNWVTKLGKQSEVILLQEDVKEQEDAYSAYTVDVPENQYPMSEQTTFYQFIASQFGVFQLPPVSPEIDETACQALKISPELTQYQKFIREYMRSVSPYRGILVYHGLGSGKTCTAIAAAESLYNSDPGRKIVVLTPSSLQENFVNELSFCGFKHYRLQNHWVPFEVTPVLRQYAIEVMRIPKTYIDSTMPSAEKKAREAGGTYTKQIWIPDFDQPEPNFDALSPTNQTQIRQQIRATVKGNITFIGYTGIGKEQLSELWKAKAFDNAVIVIDEVHNLTRLMDNKLTRYLVAPKGKQSKVFDPIPADPSVAPLKGYLKEVKDLIRADGKKKGQSEEVIKDRLKQTVKEYYDRAYLFYRIFAEAKNSKLIALSGTPIVNYPTELAIGLNFLHGYFYTCSFTIQSSTDKVLNKVRDYCTQHPKIGFFEVLPRSDRITVFITLIKDGYAKIVNDENEVVGVEKQAPTAYEVELIEEGDILGGNRNIPVRRKFAPSIQDLYAEFVENFQSDEALKGKIDSKPAYDALPLFPVDRETFTEQFVDVDEETVTFSLKADVKLKFARRLAGLVSYYKGAKKDYMPSATSNLISCVMSNHQLKTYNDVRTSELTEKKSKSGKFIDTDDLKEQQSSYRFASRSASNFVFPEEIPRPRPGIRDLLIEAGEATTDVEGQDLANQNSEALEAQKEAEHQAAEVAQEEGSGGEEAEEAEEEEGATESVEEGTKPQSGGGVNGKTVFRLKKPLTQEARAALAKPEEAQEPTKSYPEKLASALAALRKNKDKLFSMDPAKPEKQQLRFYSQKFHNMIENILKPQQIGPNKETDITDVSSLVYSAFKTVEGLGVFSIALEAQGFVPIQLAGTDKNPILHPDTVKSFQNPDHDGKRYILYTGDYSPFQRQVLLNVFNCNKEKLAGPIATALDRFEHNQTGQLCRVFMITGAGAEGLSLKNVRRVHIMEPYWNKVRTDQVQGRAIRICSHMDLPYNANPILNQRHVDVYTYISVFPEGAAATLNETIKTRDVFNGQIYSTDRFINELAGRKDALSKDFLETAQQMAVDCTLNVTENKVDCLGVTLAVKTKKDAFFYDPRLEKDLGKAEAVQFQQKAKTPVEEAGGTKIVATGKGGTTREFWIVKRSEGAALFYDLYDVTNTEMEKPTRLTEERYKSILSKMKPK